MTSLYSSEYGKRGLHDERAGVEILVNEVNRAAGEFYAIFEALAAFEPRERGSSEG